MNLIDPALSRNNPNSTAHTAGTTFMGQFMDHDMTFDLTSRLGEPTDPEKSTNTRTPAFDLDSVYGGGRAKIMRRMSTWSGATHPSSRLSTAASSKTCPAAWWAVWMATTHPRSAKPRQH